MLGVADGFCVSAFFVFEGALEVVTDSVTLVTVVDWNSEVGVWSRFDVELSVAEEGASEVLFIAEEEAESSDDAESDRFHCCKFLVGVQYTLAGRRGVRNSPSTVRR